MQTVEFKKQYATISRQTETEEDKALLKQQNLALTILKLVQGNVDSEALIAGGAPRNWVYQKQAKDLDLYFRTHMRPSAVRSLLTRLLKDNFKEVSKVKTKNLEQYNFGSYLDIINLYNFKVDGVDVQFIRVQENRTKPSLLDKIDYQGTSKNQRTILYSFQEEVLLNIDVGLCRIGLTETDHDLDKLRLMSFGNMFQKDYEENLLTLYMRGISNTQLRRSLAVHVPKLQSYYPNRTFIVNNIQW